MLTPLEFYMRVVTLAKDKKISIAQLERNAGLPLGTIKSWKKAFPSGDKIGKIADCLHTSTDYLLGRINNPNPRSEPNYSMATYKIIEAAETYKITDFYANAVVSLIEALMKESK